MADVYVLLLSHDYEGSDLRGVFVTPEAAMADAAERDENVGEWVHIPAHEIRSFDHVFQVGESWESAHPGYSWSIEREPVKT